MRWTIVAAWLAALGWCMATSSRASAESWLDYDLGSSCVNCDSCCGDSAPATLFLWSADPSARGGPAGRDEPLVADRPDFTEASSTVGRGVMQFEYGYTYYYDRSATGETSHLHTYPELLLRWGLFADWFEARLAWSYAHEIGRGGGGRTSDHGGEDLYLGVKLGLTPQAGVLPEMALIVQATTPTGVDAFTAGRTLPGVNWLYGWELTDRWSLTCNTQVNRAADDGTGALYTELAHSLAVGVEVAGALGAYGEWFVLCPMSSDTMSTEHYFNGGLTYHVTNDLMFDVRAGWGLSDAAADFFGGIGGAARF